MNRVLLAVLFASPLAAQSLFLAPRGAAFVPGQSPYDITSGDVDGDGDPDLIIANDYYEVKLFLNDGRGRFTDGTPGRLTTPPIHQNATYEVDLVDIDGDRDLDLLLCNDHYRPDRVHVNNGAGVFTDVSATALPPNSTWSVDQVVGDFDGDGDVDWIVIDWYGLPDYYLNNGAGVFTEVAAARLPAGARGTGACTIAQDLDGDGDLDLLLAPSPPLVNQGNGTFQFGFPSLPTGYWYTVADLDGDGRLDVVVDGTRHMRNQGGGQFLDVTASTRPPGSYVTHAIDVDLDGDLDLVGNTRLLLNNGAGRFLAAHDRAPRSFYPPLVALDIDGDRDTDYVTQYGSVYVNLLRHVDAPVAATRGQTYQIDLHLRPGFLGSPALMAPVLGFAEAAVPLGPLGTFRVLPSTAITLPVQAMPSPTGRTQLSYPIPALNALRGLALHHQALVVDPALPLRLSNAVVDVVQ